MNIELYEVINKNLPEIMRRIHIVPVNTPILLTGFIEAFNSITRDSGRQRLSELNNNWPIAEPYYALDISNASAHVMHLLPLNQRDKYDYQADVEAAIENALWSRVPKNTPMSLANWSINNKRICYVNESCAATLGISPTSMIGKWAGKITNTTSRTRPVV